MPGVRRHLDRTRIADSLGAPRRRARSQRGGRPMAERLTRRHVLKTGSAAALLVTTGVRVPAALGATPTQSTEPFTLGVASGDPTHHSVVLWTRLAPDPLDGGGMPPAPVGVEWQIATDPQMRHVVRRGVKPARPEAAHSAQQV